MAMVLLSCWAWPAVVRAETESVPSTPPRFWDRPLSFNLVLGFGTPTGEVGATAEYSFSKWLAAGAGLGIDPVFGMQTAAFGRLRFGIHEGPRRAHAVSLVGAFSAGEYGSLFSAENYWTGWAYWVQAGIDYEFLGRRFRFATGLGVAILLGTTEEKREGFPGSPLGLLPTVHITVGFN